jgi:hypothetical protein
MRCLRDAQDDSIADRRDFDIQHNIGRRSLPIVESRDFCTLCGPCAVCVRYCAALCGAVRCCAVVCGFSLAFTNWNDERRATTSVELANDVGAPC